MGHSRFKIKAHKFNNSPIKRQACAAPYWYLYRQSEIKDRYSPGFSC